MQKGTDLVVRSLAFLIGGDKVHLHLLKFCILVLHLLLEVTQLPLHSGDGLLPPIKLYKRASTRVKGDASRFVGLFACLHVGLFDCLNP